MSDILSTAGRDGSDKQTDRQTDRHLSIHLWWHIGGILTCISNLSYVTNG